MLIYGKLRLLHCLLLWCLIRYYPHNIRHMDMCAHTHKHLEELSQGEKEVLEAILPLWEIKIGWGVQEEVRWGNCEESLRSNNPILLVFTLVGWFPGQWKEALPYKKREEKLLALRKCWDGKCSIKFSLLSDRSLSSWLLKLTTRLVDMVWFHIFSNHLKMSAGGACANTLPGNFLNYS